MVQPLLQEDAGTGIPLVEWRSSGKTRLRLPRAYVVYPAPYSASISLEHGSHALKTFPASRCSRMNHKYSTQSVELLQKRNFKTKRRRIMEKEGAVSSLLRYFGYGGLAACLLRIVQ